MRDTADHLIPLSYPLVDFNVEQDVLILKQRTLLVDGYEVMLCFSKSDYGDYLLEALQIKSMTSPFLPFHLVCKIARTFLGSECLTYYEIPEGNRKIYLWTAKIKDERVLTPDSTTKEGIFEGFRFYILQPGSIDLISKQIMP